MTFKLLPTETISLFHKYRFFNYYILFFPPKINQLFKWIPSYTECQLGNRSWSTAQDCTPSPVCLKMKLKCKNKHYWTIMAYIFISKNLMTFRHVNFYKKKTIWEHKADATLYSAEALPKSLASVLEAPTRAKLSRNTVLSTSVTEHRRSWEEKQLWAWFK